MIQEACIMAHISKELKNRIIKARSADEVAALLRPSGVDDALAARIWNELSANRDDRQLSLDELEAISGGDADRDWLTDGCAATVEPNSWCGSNDSCIWWDVTYDHEPANIHCPNCGAIMYINWVDYYTDPSHDVYHYKCKNCGCEKAV